MAVPRNRCSNASKGSRRSHHRKKTINFVPCSNCGTLTISHRICLGCGSYKGRQFLKVEAE